MKLPELSHFSVAKEQKFIRVFGIGFAEIKDCGSDNIKTWLIWDGNWTLIRKLNGRWKSQLNTWLIEEKRILFLSWKWMSLIMFSSRKSKFRWYLLSFASEDYRSSSKKGIGWTITSKYFLETERVERNYQLAWSGGTVVFVLVEIELQDGH